MRTKSIDSKILGASWEMIMTPHWGALKRIEGTEQTSFVPEGRWFPAKPAHRICGTKNW